MAKPKKAEKPAKAKQKTVKFASLVGNTLTLTYDDGTKETFLLSGNLQIGNAPSPNENDEDEEDEDDEDDEEEDEDDEDDEDDDDDEEEEKPKKGKAKPAPAKKGKKK